MLVVFILSRKAVSGLAAIATVDLQITNLVCYLHRKGMRHAQKLLGFACAKRGEGLKTSHSLCKIVCHSYSGIYMYIDI